MAVIAPTVTGLKVTQHRCVEMSTEILSISV